MMHDHQSRHAQKEIAYYIHLPYFSEERDISFISSRKEFLKVITKRSITYFSSYDIRASPWDVDYHFPFPPQCKVASSSSISLKPPLSQYVFSSLHAVESRWMMTPDAMRKSF